MQQMVNAYRVRTGTTVTLTTHTAGAAVIGYAARLFHVTVSGASPVQDWTRAQLEAGQASFVFDATGTDRYEISMGIDVSADTTLGSTTTFNPAEQPPDGNTLSVSSSEGLPIRIWFFFPFA